MQAALAGLLVVALLATVGWRSADRVPVGEASLGLHLYQVCGVLAGSASPLIYDRLARHRQLQLPPLPPQARMLALAVVTLAAALALAGWWRPGWSGWLWPAALLLPAGLAAAGARVAATLLQSRGDYVELSLQALWRLLLAAALTAAALPALPAAVAVGLALLVTELLSWWRSWHRLRRVAPAPAP